MAVEGVNFISNGIALPVKSPVNSDGTVNFKDILVDALNNVNALELESAKMTEDFIAGRTDDIHSVLIASEKATISLQFVMEVRNKIVEAYQEIMRMQF
ncbi:MAG: flagellar hook-basal body complex protein FliE [Acetivibrionales bacterium]|jgi:flagellar hook-basal body complex protein FliE